jgi:DNA mismatch repair protein MutL
MSQPVIRVLDENTANKIAAGEVVERPASVVKELVENSLDAYSHTIEVAIVDGGVSLIRVTDDGVGMSRADANLAILRHATSKIGSVEDLYSVHSLGFRGEALPSIASVSKFTLTTRLHNEDFATYVEVNGGLVADSRDAGAGVGTTITVADLFYNTPARRKFLKTAQTESGYIHDIIGKLALSHPEVGFKLMNNQRLVLSTPGNGNLIDTLVSLYGPKVSPELLPVNYEGEEVSITGYIAKPTLIKSSRQWQTFLVNGRVVSSRMVGKALDNAYHSLLPKAGYPLAVLNIAVPAHSVDVNVHPQKSEIKFSDEGKIFKAVYHGVGEALATPEQTDVAATVTTWHNPVTTSSYPPPSVQQPVNLWREEAASFTAVRETIKRETDLPGFDNPFTAKIDDKTDEPEAALTAIGQVADCYIIAQGADGLYIIDQHAAHERILYDKLSQSTGRIPVQQLLVPELIDFDLREIRIIMENLATFYELGFTLDQAGPNTVRLSELPADVPPAEARSFLQDILILMEKSQSPSAAALRHACMQTAACRAAIKAGDQLNMRQLQALVSELGATSRPYTCPHGRPTIIKFTADELAKMFKRT